MTLFVTVVAFAFLLGLAWGQPLGEILLGAVALAVSAIPEGLPIALTVALAVFRAQAPGTGTDWAGLMAATLIAALPMILLFAVFAKRVVNSIGFTGIK